MKLKLPIIIAAIILILDQMTKYIAKTALEPSQSVPLIKNVFHFTLVHNPGAGFGILQNSRWLLIIISLLVLGWIIWKWKEIEPKYTIPLALILGGLLGNLIDRIVIGYVIDFADFRIFPVFNIADSAISIAAIWLLFLSFWKRNP